VKHIKEQFQRLAELITSILNAAAVTNNVQSRTKRHKAIFFAMNECCKTFIHDVA